MNEQIRFNELKEEFERKLEILLKEKDKKRKPNILDPGDADINELWQWFREECFKIYNKEK